MLKHVEPPLNIFAEDEYSHSEDHTEEVRTRPVFRTGRKKTSDNSGAAAKTVQNTPKPVRPRKPVLTKTRNRPANEGSAPKSPDKHKLNIFSAVGGIGAKTKRSGFTIR